MLLEEILVGKLRQVEFLPLETAVAAVVEAVVTAVVTAVVPAVVPVVLANASSDMHQYLKEVTCSHDHDLDQLTE